MKRLEEIIKEKPKLAWLLFAATVLAVFIIGIIASTIMQRRAETSFAYRINAGLWKLEPRLAKWGKSFPDEYESYRKTRETNFASKHGGSAKIDMLERFPELVVLWAGYAFSKDYNQGRGHWYAVTDVRNSLRTGAPTNSTDGPQPGTCWTCKSTDVPRLMDKIGASNFYQGKWAAIGSEIVNPIGCADCHAPETMELRITRPALKEALVRGGKNLDEISHQEMRSLVCAQCHVEYYFQKPAQTLIFPWDKGKSAEQIEEYYDSIQWKDFTNTISGAPIIKAQHPDYELFQAGIHAQRGVSCADCHMPYRSEGGKKFTDHHIQSPLASVETSCQVCHRESRETLIANVIERQDQITELRHNLEKLLAKAHIEAGFARSKGAPEKDMKESLGLIRAAQWRWDFVAASHGAAFHAPTESARILGTGIEKAQESRLQTARVLAQLGWKSPVPMPDISTKEKAQKFIGLDMEKLISDKEKFIKTMLPKWDEEAEKREAAYPAGN